jgi:hypothetical protein
MVLVKYIWEDFERPKLKFLKEKYNLEQVVDKGKSEFEKQLLLKEWVHGVLPHGNNPKLHYKDAIEILEGAKKGDEFYCTHYALTFIQTATALGWYSRKVSIDSDHGFREEEMHHGVCDIWTSTYKKWYVLDVQHNLHFEKDGIPLNVYEIRMEYLKNKAENVTGVLGQHKKRVYYNSYKKGFNQPSNYFWFFILLRNNFFMNPNIYDAKALLWIDKYNINETWFMGGKNKGRYRKHPLYKKGFIKTSDINFCFPRIE